MRSRRVTPGKYKLSVKAPGFNVKTVGGLELLVNTPTTVNVTLDIGQMTETVAVQAEAAQLNTTDASLGNAVGTQAIVELPFEARNPASLLALQAGVTLFRYGQYQCYQLRQPVERFREWFQARSK